MPKDSIHEIKSIRKFDCGCYIIDIGKILDNIDVNLKCSKHGGRYDKYGKSWFNAESFRPLQQASFPLLTLSKIKETEKEEILTAN